MNRLSMLALPSYSLGAAILLPQTWDSNQRGRGRPGSPKCGY